MGYSNKFVLCLLMNGTIQQERKDGTLEIPFGSEYGIRLRNKNDRRAVGELYLDGEVVGRWAVPANGHIDIFRHQKFDRAFKFVSLDSGDAHEHGKSGDNADKGKGVVEARFYLEKAASPTTVIHHYHHTTYGGHVPRSSNVYDDGHRSYSGGAAVMPSVMPLSDCDSDSTYQPRRGGAASLDASRTKTISQNYCAPAGGYASACASMPTSAPVVQDGCTVEGRATGQRFGTTSIECEEAYTSVMIVLRGFTPPYAPTPAPAPVAVLPIYNETPSSIGFCTSCGKPCNSTDAFCGQCGKSLR
jgi:hypothetical protein